jgi:5-methylthioribose kinase
MIEVDARTLLDYFAGPGSEYWQELGLSTSELRETQVSELAWGVSNVVLRVDAPSLSFVVKQSREKLRTAIDWFSQLERVWRETKMLRTLNRVLPDDVVPRVLFEDRQNYLFGMQAVEADHLVWKAELLAGRIDSGIAPVLAQHLSKIHSIKVDTPDGNLSVLANRDIFDELRLDPFYRYMAETIPQLRDVLLDLINTTLSFQPLTLVLADFSPKNILLTKRGPVIVDFETGHLGDPAFDIGFFLSHLLLKVVHHGDSSGSDSESKSDRLTETARQFWSVYLDGIRQTAPWLLRSESAACSNQSYERQCVRHLAACMLSRVDGKSRIDYLPSESQTRQVREFCHALLLGDCSLVSDAMDRLNDR